MYRQFDGYPDIHGEELKGILAGVPIGNGIPSGEYRSMLNGMNELAAVLVRELKARHDIGGIYLVPPEWPPVNHWQEYEWFVFGAVGDSEASVYYRRTGEPVLRYWFGPRGFNDAPEVLRQWVRGRR